MDHQSGASAVATYGDILVGHVLATMAVINSDHTLAFINRAIGNQSPEALIGAPAVAVYTTASAQALLQQAIEQVLRTGEPFSYECEEVTGEAYGCYLNQLSAIKQDGYITNITLLVIDISAQKQAAAAQAQAQKLASLNTLVGGVAHNFNNLLAAMLIQLASGAAKLPIEHPVSQHILRTMTAAERAAELTRQLLNYAGLSPREAGL
jgi:signal transduction histidine kinase